MCGSEYKLRDTNCTSRMADMRDGEQEFQCAHYKFSCIVHPSVFLNNNEVYQQFNAIVLFLLKRPRYDRNDGHSWTWRFFYEEESKGEPIPVPTSERKWVSYNIANEMADYPCNFKQQIDKILLALSTKYPAIGSQILISGYDRALYYITKPNPMENTEEIRGMLSRLTELGYMCAQAGHHYEISANGWIRIGELSSDENEINQGFIAMSFANETKEISEAFSDTIRECGYLPRRIDEKEHNNQIVPEIFFEIKRSKFLVVDVTHPNHGAYYEAGYGEALNKQVIVCCKKDSLKNAHFDIAQKNAVIWETIEDLKKCLKRRIEATVGIENRPLLR